jgi:hypothetical protein
MYKSAIVRSYSMDLSSHRQEIACSLAQLEASLSRLVAALAHGSVAVQMESSTSDESAVRLACEAYSAIDYRMDDAVGDSVICLGAIGAGADILRLAERVNAAKAEFKKICTPLQGIRIRIPVKGNTGPTKAIPAIRVLLRNIQRSDLNLLAAYRKIPLLKATPASLTFTRANTRAVYRKSVEEIDQMLANLGAPTSLRDRKRLTTLDRRETHLALVKDRYQNIRANVLYAHLDSRGRGRVQIAAELPILYPKGRRAEPPQVRFPQPPDPDELPRARQSKLEAHSFLESLPVYRYARHGNERESGLHV